MNEVRRFALALTVPAALVSACMPPGDAPSERCAAGETITAQADKIERAAEALSLRDMEQGGHILHLGPCSCQAYGLAISRIDRREPLPSTPSRTDLNRAYDAMLLRGMRVDVIDHARSTFNDEESPECRVTLYDRDA